MPGNWHEIVTLVIFEHDQQTVKGAIKGQKGDLTVNSKSDDWKPTFYGQSYQSSDCLIN